MKDIKSIKKKISDQIDADKQDIINFGEAIMDAPELGFKEFKTAQRFMDEAKALGLEYESGLGRTGVKVTVKGGKPGPCVAVLGELDALVVEGHPRADKETNAAHACGHNAQMAGLTGAMKGLCASGVMAHLSGSVSFIAVPAEEPVEIEFRTGLRKKGELGFLTGKPELVRIGAFDDVDMVVMAHTSVAPQDKTVVYAPSYNGFVSKMVKYIGTPSHAGASPDKGVNALYAAQVGLSALNALRETFRDEDSVRIHPIITRGGDLVNIIPAEVTMEVMVRAKTLNAIKDADTKLDRALKAGAMALGATVEIETMPGFLPVIPDYNLLEVFLDNCRDLFGSDQIAQIPHTAGSTDLGDLSQLMPAIHPYFIGASGTFHGADWLITNPEKAYVAPARTLALTVADLLANDAGKAKEILGTHTPALTKAGYLDLLNSMFTTQTFSY